MGFFTSFGMAIFPHAKALFPITISATVMTFVNFFTMSGGAVFMPILGKVIETFLDDMFKALTKPLTAEEKKTGFLMRDPQPRLLPPETPTNLVKLFEKNLWTDGLPIILPTEAKVAEMLKGTSHKPDEIVGTMRPSPPHEAWEFNVEMVAANAVMAGAGPTGTSDEVTMLTVAGFGSSPILTFRGGRAVGLGHSPTPIVRSATLLLR
jgi:hypothetical protein